MSSPAKRRKLNNSSKSSSAPARNLDFFFGKQKLNGPARPSNDDEQNPQGPSEASELMDEQLARKLQAQWDQEEEAQEAEGSAEQTASKDAKAISFPSDPDYSTSARSNGDVGLNGDQRSGDTAERPVLGSKAESKPQEPRKNTLSLQSTGSAEDIITSTIPFDESPLTFEPSKYLPDLQGHWAAEGGSASYALLTRCFVLVNSTQSRIKIVDTLVNLLRIIIEGDPTSLLPTVRTIYDSAMSFNHKFWCILCSYLVSSLYLLVCAFQCLNAVMFTFSRCGWQRIRYLLHIYP